jgi:hypothetical protein
MTTEVANIENLDFKSYKVGHKIIIGWWCLSYLKMEDCVALLMKLRKYLSTGPRA